MGDHDGVKSAQELRADDIRAFLEALKPQINDLGLDAESKDELISDIQTIEVQLSKPEPNRGKLREALKSIGGFLGKVGVATAAKVLAEQASKLLLFLA